MGRVPKRIAVGLLIALAVVVVVVYLISLRASPLIDGRRRNWAPGKVASQSDSVYALHVGRLHFNWPRRRVTLDSAVVVTDSVRNAQRSWPKTTLQGTLRGCIISGLNLPRGFAHRLRRGPLGIRCAPRLRQRSAFPGGAHARAASQAGGCRATAHDRSATWHLHDHPARAPPAESGADDPHRPHRLSQRRDRHRGPEAVRRPQALRTGAGTAAGHRRRGRSRCATEPNAAALR